MPTAIEFNNISKIYRLGLVSTGTLANDIHRWWTKKGNTVPIDFASNNTKLCDHYM